MTRNTKILFSIGLLVVVTGVALGVIHLNKVPSQDEMVESFGSALKKAQKNHPSIYQWWESLSVTDQIRIESTMTPELLAYANRELRRKNLSEGFLERLRKLGYTG